MAAWLALDWRADLKQGETVLVLGSSGVVGQIAVQKAQLLGAGKVIAASRKDEDLEHSWSLGADETVKLGGDGDLAEAFAEAGGDAGQTPTSSSTRSGASPQRPPSARSR